MIKEFTKYIKNGVSGMTIDTNLFAGFRPADCQDRCIAVLENTGGAVNSYFPDTGEKIIQVLTRAQSFWDARDDAYKVFNFLKSKSQVELPVVISPAAYTAMFIEAVNFPQSLQQDEKGRWEFSTNYVVRLLSH